MNTPQNVPPSRPENAALAPKAENNFTETDNIPLKIPRAMRRAASLNAGVPPLGDRNASSRPDESVKKEADSVYTRSPVRPRRTMEEKENHGC